jgi:hypothetical protein
MLIFRNPGLIPEAAISTLGVNAKLNDNPIGQFGTGLKYGIAIILRLGGKITIYRGLKKLEFGVDDVTIRGQSFKIVTMNGRKLGFTDQLGLNWEPWMAYRELASNAKDEGGTVRVWDSETEPSGLKGETVIYVNCKELDAAHKERGSLFLSTEPLYTLPGVEVHSGSSEFMFYRGIRVMKLQKKSKYTYNLTNHVSLTEDRTVLYAHMVSLYVAKAITQSPNRSFLTSVLDANEVKDVWEQSLPYNNDYVKDDKPTDQFMDICEYLKSEKRLLSVASSHYNHWADKDPNRVSPYNVTLSEAHEHTLRGALEKLRIAGITIERGALIFKSQLTLGRVQVAGKTTLVVDAKFLEGSENKLACVLIEGAALLQGGGPTEQLTNFILHRAWIARELTQGYDSRAMELDF